LHELATNAVKYGALSSNTGQLAIHWKTARGNRLLLTWEERATTPTQAPARRNSGGFGMQLIDKGVRHNLGGDTKVEFRPTGLYVELSVPLDQSKEQRAAPQKKAAALSA
jgi:two-component sensor histidine kinase